MPRSGSSAETSWTGVPSGTYARVARSVVVLPASRGPAKNRSEDRDRAATMSVSAISGDIVPLRTSWVRVISTAIGSSRDSHDHAIPAPERGATLLSPRFLVEAVTRTAPRPLRPPNVHTAWKPSAASIARRGRFAVPPGANWVPTAQGPDGSRGDSRVRPAGHGGNRARDQGLADPTGPSTSRHSPSRSVPASRRFEPSRGLGRRSPSHPVTSVPAARAASAVSWDATHLRRSFRKFSTEDWT